MVYERFFRFELNFEITNLLKDRLSKKVDFETNNKIEDFNYIM